MCYVQPHFDCCSVHVVWGDWNKSLSIKLQNLQNRAARTLSPDVLPVYNKVKYDDAQHKATTPTDYLRLS